MRFSIGRVEERQGGERGQMLVIVALMFVVIVGAMALAVDLSATTNAHRVISNWSDASAIAGVRDCDTACNAQTEVTGAIQVVLQNSPWNTPGSTWPALALASAGTCNSSSCRVTDYPGPAGFTDYHVSVSSPPDPLTTTNPAYITTNYVEVHIKQTLNTNFAGAIGVKTTKTVGHSIAYDAGPPGPYQYTFFTKKEAGSGNSDEIVQGDVFLGDGYSPQATGQSELCVTEVAEPNPDAADGDAGGGIDNDLDNQGHVVFGVVPPTVGPDPGYSKTCGGGKSKLNVQQVSPSAGANCPSGSTPTQSGGVWFCFQSNPAVPNVPPPVPTKAAICGTNINTAFAAANPGVYPVSNNCNVTLDFSGGNIQCISLVLGTGSTVSIDNKSSQQWITSYGFDPGAGATLNTVAQTAMNNVSPPAQSTVCGGHSTNSDRSVIWAADPGVLNTTTPAVVNSTTGGGGKNDTLFIGTIFLPNQQVNFNSNQTMEDVGSIYVGDWQVQSGNHHNPVVTYDIGATTFLATGLRLAE